MKKFNYTKWLTESKHGKPLNEELDANKIKDLLKNLIDNSEVDSDIRSDLVGIILPSLEKANAPEELVKNLEILSNKYNTDQGVSLAQQPDEVKNAITYLTGDKAQKSVDQIGDVAGGYADALKPETEKIYTADAFPDGLKDSDFYKKSVKDGWKFITKNSLTPDQEKIAKSLPTKSDGTPLKERIQELSLDQKAKLYFMGLVRKGVIDTLPEDPKAAYIRDIMDKEDPKTDPAIRSDFDDPVFEDLKEIGMFHDPLGYDPEDSADSKEDKLKMAYAAYDKAEMNGDIRGQELALAVIDLLKSGELKEMATELGYLKEIDLNAVSYEKVTFIYTEQGGRFYGLDVYENKDQPQRSAKLRYDEANEWLKDTLHYIHEGDLIPKSYNSGLEDLDLIVARLKELGIEASHGDYMDVS